MSCTLYRYSRRIPVVPRERDKSLRNFFFVSCTYTMRVILLCAILQLHTTPLPLTVKYNNIIYNGVSSLPLEIAKTADDARKSHTPTALYNIIIYIINYTLLKISIKFRLETRTYTCRGGQAVYFNVDP